MTAPNDPEADSAERDSDATDDGAPESKRDRTEPSAASRQREAIDSERVSVAATELDLEQDTDSGGQATIERLKPARQQLDDNTIAPTTINLRRVTLASANDQSRAQTPAPDAYVGYIIDGRYHIQTLLAQGGMGVVYLARHRLIDKPIAVKILRSELVHDREITQRFLTEAQAASAIGSEHIVDITDYGELPDGATYIVMEYLEGDSLNERIRSGELLSIHEVLSIGRQLAEALARAHAAQIIHRDLKPDNVFLIERGKRKDFVKILDFGIAKVASSQNQITRAGKIFGTPHYMSPEQAKGDALDRRTDIYSLGVMLYEMTTGQVPFEGENPLGVLTQHMYVEPKPLHEMSDREIPVGLEAVITKCLSKNPNERYSSMLELEEDLARVAEGIEPLAVEELEGRARTPESLRSRIAFAGQGSGRAGVVGGIAIAVLLSGGAYWVTRYKPDESVVAPAAASSASAVTAAASTQDPASTVVNLVLSPVDARVYQGKRDLGAMPISVRLLPGQKMELQVRRPGYNTETVTIDGSESRKVVELQRTPGSPDVPVPTGVPDPAAARTIGLAPDAGAFVFGAARAPERRVTVDAGAHARHQPAPDSPEASFPSPVVPELKPRRPSRSDVEAAPPGPPPMNTDGAHRPGPAPRGEGRDGTEPGAKIPRKRAPQDVGEDRGVDGTESDARE